jgi:GNAT superfamily N-acetyltransferase
MKYQKIIIFLSLFLFTTIPIYSAQKFAWIHFYCPVRRKKIISILDQHYHFLSDAAEKKALLKDLTGGNDENFRNCAVLVYDAREVGFLKFHIHKRRAHIETLVVHEKYLRQGFGTQLLQHAIETIQERARVRSITVGLPTIELAEKFCTPHGFKLAFCLSNVIRMLPGWWCLPDRCPKHPLGTEYIYRLRIKRQGILAACLKSWKK